MKLKSVTLRSFRGFSAETTLVFGDTNVFAGPNGFGKTSLFDAIQWALFGAITRLAGNRDFVKAGDVLKNKFSEEPYFVALEIENNGTAFYRKRTANQVISQIDRKPVTEIAFLRGLGLLGENSHQRFLRHTLLEQERVNDFVRDLNPRDRYDALVSFLELSVPGLLSDRLGVLSGEGKVVHQQLSWDVDRQNSRREVLERDIAALNKTKSTVSFQAIETQLQALITEFSKFVPTVDFVPLVTGSIQERISGLLESLGRSIAAIDQVLAESRILDDLRPHTQFEGSDPEKAKLLITGKIAELEKIPPGEQQLSDLSATLESLSRDIAEREKTQGRYLSLLREFRAYVTSDTCPLCGQPIARDAVLLRIDEELKRQPQDLVRAINSSKEVDVALQSGRGLKEARLRDLAEAKTQLARVQEAIFSRAKVEQSLNKIRNSGLFSLINSKMDVPEEWRMTLSPIREQLQSLERRALELGKLLDQIKAVELLPGKESELSAVQASLNETMLQITTLESTLRQLSRLSEAVLEARRNLIQGIVDSNKPLIASLYKRLQPHPLFTEIDLEVSSRVYKEAELFLRVRSRDLQSTAYPSTVFSASQLNALAICVFLALNLRSVDTHSLMMLDDPIHSMDDINVLGLSDLLRELKPRRQLFISTHNLSFYRLLLNKLRPLSSDDQVKGFHFEGWSREGPHIREESVEMMQLPVDINQLASSILSH